MKARGGQQHTPSGREDIRKLSVARDLLAQAGVVAQLWHWTVHIVTPCGWTGCRSKVSPARYRITNGSSSNGALRKRGSLLIRRDKKRTWLAPHDGRPGRPAVFSDAAIQICLTIKVVFKVPPRRTAGRAAFPRKRVNQDCPVLDDTTLCRRQKTLAVQIPEGEEIGTVTADGAYDTRRCHSPIIDSQAAEIQSRIALMNRFPAPGTAEIIRAA